MDDGKDEVIGRWMVETGVEVQVKYGENTVDMGETWSGPVWG